MLKRYHIDKNGDPVICDAQIRCRVRGADQKYETAHFVGTLSEAREWAEKENRKKYPILSSSKSRRSLTKAKNTHRITESQRQSASAARIFQKARLEKVLSEYLVEEQAVYDATESGGLELQRRLNQERKNEDASEDVIEELVRREEAAALLREDPEYHNHLSVNNLTEEESSSASEIILSNKETNWQELAGKSEEAMQLKYALIDKSAQWVERLTADEVEALSWHTSNGSSVMRAYSQDKEHHIWGYNIHSKQELSQAKKSLESAFAKAPELDDPITLYRGVDLERATVNVDDIIENNEYSSPIAESFSMSLKTANGFSGYGKDGVILEISTRKIASPACVSAWGAQEYEMLSKPNARYQVAEKTVEEFYGAEVTVLRLEEID